MPIWELYKIKNKTKQKLGTFMEYFRILPIWVEGSLGDQVLMPTIVSSKLEIATLHRRVWWINLSNYSEILSFWAHQLKYFQAERAKKKAALNDHGVNTSIYLLFHVQKRHRTKATSKAGCAPSKMHYASARWKPSAWGNSKNAWTVRNSRLKRPVLKSNSRWVKQIMTASLPNKLVPCCKIYDTSRSNFWKKEVI